MPSRSSLSASVLAGPILGAVLLPMLFGVARADQGQATWTTYMYQGPSDRFPVVGEVSQAQVFDIGPCSNGWCQITYDRATGYVRDEIIARGDPTKPSGDLLPQPAAALMPTAKGPCFTANQKGGNGGNAMTRFCAK